MSDFSRTLVLRLEQAKIINIMAKVQIKSERITPLEGIFLVRKLFTRYVGPTTANTAYTSETGKSYELWIAGDDIVRFSQKLYMSHD